MVAPIVKVREGREVLPNLRDYEAARAAFSWNAARSELEGLPDGRGLNIAYEAVDRHAAGTRRDKRALRWLGRNGTVRDFTFLDLARLTSRFANVLRALDVDPRRQGVHAPRPGAGALRHRARNTEGRQRLLPALLRLRARADPRPGWRSAKRASSSRPSRSTGERSSPCARPCPTSSTSSCSPTATPAPDAPGTHDLTRLMTHAGDELHHSPRRDPEDVALLHFTSGTTGKPKGAVHVHEAVVAHHVTGRLALDLHPDDVFWCTADPGWVTGTSYGIIAPAHQRRHEHRRRSRLRRRALVRHPAGRAGHRLVHRTDRDPDADEGRSRAGPQIRLARLAVPGQRRRAAQPGGRRLGRRRPSACRSTTTGGRPRRAGS